VRAKRAYAGEHADPTGRVARCDWRALGPTACGAAAIDTWRLGSRLLGLGSRLVGSARGVDGLMGFGPNWAFLGLNFWVFLGKLAQIQLFSSKT